MKKIYFLIIIAIVPFLFSGCSQKQFSVSDEIEIRTTKETIDENYDKLNELVTKINEQHLLQEIHLKFPDAKKSFIQTRVSKTKTSYDLPGKEGETFCLKVSFTMNYDETKAEEAAAILKFYKMLYSEELTKLNVPLKEPQKFVSL